MCSSDLTRKCVDLASGDKISVIQQSLKVIRDWRRGDQISVFEVFNDGQFIGYQLQNTTRNSMALGTIYVPTYKRR